MMPTSAFKSRHQPQCQQLSAFDHRTVDRAPKWRQLWAKPSAIETALFAHLDPCALDHDRPLRNLRLDNGSEFRGRIADQIKTESFETCAHLRQSERALRLAVDLFDHGGRRPGWGYQTEPRNRFKPPISRFCHRRQVGCCC